MTLDNIVIPPAVLAQEICRSNIARIPPREPTILGEIDEDNYV